MKTAFRWLRENILYLAWLVALVGTSMSLYFSEILHFAPCVLCWWQRVFLYPLVIILLVGILKKDKGVYFYAMPLSFLGTLVAFYHTLLQAGIIPESLAPCAEGVSCTTKYFEIFHVITIPFLSLLAFVFITFCLFVDKKLNKL